MQQAVFRGGTDILEVVCFPNRRCRSLRALPRDLAVRIDPPQPRDGVIQLWIRPFHSGTVVPIRLPDGDQPIAYQLMRHGIEVIQRAGVARRNHRSPTTGGLEQRIAPPLAAVQRDITVATRVQRRDLMITPRLGADRDAGPRGYSRTEGVERVLRETG